MPKFIISSFINISTPFRIVVESEVIMKKFQISKYPILFTLLLFMVPIFVYAQNDSQAEGTGLQPMLHSEYVISKDANRLKHPSALAENPQEQTECPLDPCEMWGCQSLPVCGSSRDSSFRLFQDGSRLKFQGWVESGLYTNAHGATSRYDADGLMSNSGNGPNMVTGLRTTDYNMNQLWGRLIREMDCKNGLDWGFQADLVYGMYGYGVQACDNSFDSGWGSGDYGLGFHQLYGELGYKKLTARYGKFSTLIGWEESPSWNNFFYSHSYCFNTEPCTHTGAMLYYQLTDGLKLAGGWTAGKENSFANRYGDQAFITGLELALTKKSTVYYYMTQGRLNDSFGAGYVTDYFNQSLCFEWNLTDQWTYVFQYDMYNANEYATNRISSYGINNHLIYRFCKKWAVGLRAEWLRDNGVLAYEDALGNSNDSDYVELTLGLNYHPTDNLRIRPEIRYDHAFKNPIFAYGTKNEQLSGGFAILFGF